MFRPSFPLRPPSPSDRRASARYSAKEPKAFLRWIDDGGERAIPCWLANLSLGGALVIVAEAPPLGRALVLFLAPGLVPTEKARATILDVRRLSRRRHFLRLRFNQPCPPAFFQAATRGFPALLAVLN